MDEGNESKWNEESVERAFKEFRNKEIDDNTGRGNIFLNIFLLIMFLVFIFIKVVSPALL